VEIFTVVGLTVDCSTATQITTTVRNAFAETKNKDKPVVSVVICLLEVYQVVSASPKECRGKWLRKRLLKVAFSTSWTLFTKIWSR